MKLLFTLFATLIFQFTYSQTWQDVGGGTNNSSHGMLTYNGKLIDLGSFNNPCGKVAEWDGTSWNCLGGGVGIVARAGVVWDGKLVVVGDFWNVFQPCVGCNGVAVWDGVSWSPLGNGVNNDVLTCTVWNNELVIGGDMTQADGVPVARIAKWNGTTWESVGPIGSFDNDIRCMTQFEDELWVGGDFNNVGGQGPLDGLVKYDESLANWVGGNSGVDLIGGVNESVRVLYVNPNDGNLYMGGEFPELIDGNVGVADFNMGGIAMYDGSDWTALGTGLNEYCRAIHEYNGDIVAGGYFTTAGGVSANKIARFDGTNWLAMGLGFDGAGIDEYVKSAAVWNGIFFAGGAYTQAEGGPMNYISQWYEPATAAPVAWMTTSTTQLCGSGCVEFLDNSTNNPTSWNWSFPGSDTPTETAQDPGQVCYATPGTYTATLQACNSIGCTTQNIDIVVEAGATVSVNDESICGGAGPVILTATPSVFGGTFFWQATGETTSSISVNPGTTTNYTVTYSYIGCVSNAISTVTVVPGTGFNIIEDVDACQNSTLTYPDATTEIITSNTSHISLLTSVSGCDSTVTTNVTMVTAYNETENVSVCENITITYPDGTNEVVTSNTSHTSLLTSVTGCDSNVVTNVTMAPNYNLNENINACENSTVVYPDGINEVITVNTSHTSNLTSTLGCDSIIVSNVTMIVAYNMNENISACENTTLSYPDGSNQVITSNTSHTSFLTSVTGCDSTIFSNVTMTPNYNLNENINACENSTVTYPDGFSESITSSTSHTSNLTTLNGCDSVIVTNVTMVTGYNQSENVSACENASVTYPDGTSETITSNTSHTSNLLSSTGCDSIIVTNVTMDINYNLNESISVCGQTAYTYPDGFSETITANTSHTSNLITSAGCDSIIVTNITMNPIYSLSENVNACEGFTYSYPDGTSEVITVNTSHTSNLTSVSGCDSTITTNVTMDLNYNTTQDVDVCSGSTYVYPDGTVSTNILIDETYTSLINTIAGCDSLIVTNLTIVSTINTTQNTSICSGDNYTYPDGVSSSNILVDESHISNLISANGCDSIITSNITVNPMPDITTVESNNIITANQSSALYTWLDCDNNNAIITGETNQSFAPSIDGNYAVEINLNGCIDTSICTLITLSIHELNSNNLTIYPNPVIDLIHIQSTIDISNVEYEIIDAQGKIIQTGMMNEQSLIDVSIIATGVYTLRLDKGELGNIRFVKQ